MKQEFKITIDNYFVLSYVQVIGDKLVIISDKEN